MVVKVVVIVAIVVSTFVVVVVIRSTMYILECVYTYTSVLIYPRSGWFKTSTSKIVRFMVTLKSIV